MDILNTPKKTNKKNGGKRPGAGRKTGSLSPENLEKALIKKHMENRIMKITDPLINAQAVLAMGQTFLYKIEKEWIKTGVTKSGKENGYWRNKKPVQVETQWEIESYLEGLVEEGDMHNDQDPGATYYYMTAKEPNNMAIDSLQNRVHGKPKETLGVDVNVKFSLKGLAEKRRMLSGNIVKIIDITEEK